MQLALASSGKRSLRLSMPQIEGPAIMKEYVVKAEGHHKFVDSLPDCSSDGDGLLCPRASRAGLQTIESSFMGFKRLIIMIEEPIDHEVAI